MANAQFQQYLMTKPKRIIKLWPTVSVGGAGAVTLQKRVFTATGATATAASSSLSAAPTTGVGFVVGDAAGTATVARTGTGLWTFTFSYPFQYLLGAALVQTSNTSGLLTSGFGVGVVSGSTTPRTNTSVGSGGVVAIALNNGSGAATDPASGDVLTFEFTFGDATEP